MMQPYPTLIRRIVPSLASGKLRYAPRISTQMVDLPLLFHRNRILYPCCLFITQGVEGGPGSSWEACQAGPDQGILTLADQPRYMHPMSLTTKHHCCHVSGQYCSVQSQAHHHRAEKLLERQHLQKAAALLPSREAKHRHPSSLVPSSTYSTSSTYWTGRRCKVATLYSLLCFLSRRSSTLNAEGLVPRSNFAGLWCFQRAQ